MKSRRMLIVEDDLASIMLFEEYLSNKPGIIDYARNGKEACQLIDQNIYKLILLDIQLPDISGLDICLHIKEKYPQTIIVAQTAYALKENEEQYMKYGFDDYIAKPFRQEKLLSLIEKYY